ncbi:MAG TPA: DEAD/DEAH box helicase family protein [Arachnia sp.]|nr:DEAD/DEAH box helicase family protein [Arachnia sp.]
MVDYFGLDPVLADRYENVSRWIDWDHRAGAVDTGIDLVAQDRASGEWTAIQCKFYEPDHHLAKSDIDSFFTASGKTWDGVSFDNRIIISTTDRWSVHAEDALDGQRIPVQRIGVEHLTASPIDWAFASPDGLRVEIERAARFRTLPHQDEAIASIVSGLEELDRGQWISACGTGKTFTSLKLAERLSEARGGSLRVLFLAPSIQLVAQTLREWTAQSAADLRAFVVCSDTSASRAAEDISPHDLPLPASTDPVELRDRLAAGRRGAGLSVVFSTYQSVGVVAEAQSLGADAFDLILCDEAHRTTGVQLAGESESAFTRVHDAQFLRGSKRLYMTATPRMFGDDVKNRADEHSAVLSSMDDESIFGPVLHRLGFGDAVERKLLTDYKVMVLAVAEEQMAAPMQLMQATGDVEIPLDDAAKIMGCWNTLAKRTRAGDPHPAFGVNEAPMRRAVGFLENIKSSKRVAEAFELVVEAQGGAEATARLAVDARHVDGTMNALTRAERLSWLKAPLPDGQCRILTNARCLTEGVDVPALDAVMFLSPRNSAVDVVQAVGRVMRKAPGKDFGYIVLPVAVPVGIDPADALRDNKRFKVVWDVLNALRAHDDRFEAIIQSINLNGGRDVSGRIIVDVPDVSADGPSGAAQMPLFGLDHWRDAIYSRIVDRVGTREYWDQWAKDVARMSAAQIARIEAILERSTPEVVDAFDRFLYGLRGNLNEAITRDDAVSMLSQHLITAPVFDALFGGSGFAASNPVSIGMQAMLDVLEGQGLDAETEHLERFYASVRARAAAVTDTAGRQQVIHDLYEKFFANAFPKQAESLGVVYTPVEIVDFILRSADELSRRHFGQGLTDEGVNILDPFTGTGTFIVRLLASGIINDEDLARKYEHELWCNEIMLLAYYIACVNIEATYEAVTGTDEYVAFPGAAMTDTFQISEHGDRADTSLIPANHERITRQLATPIQVIVANPPYSVGQTSANDNNANLRYPTLDARIADTYAKRSTGTNKNSLYDSYIRAFRWATDRLGGGYGIVAFVSNGGWLDGNTADGMRLTMADEFAELWVFNLRGNQRTAGEQSRKEGGKVFGSGSRNTVAIVLAVKHPNHEGPARIHYRDIGDYLTRDEKLTIVDGAGLDDDGWTRIVPNPAGDWLGQRDELFQNFVGIQDVFASSSAGVQTNRDPWVYNFSAIEVEVNMRRMIDTYNAEARRRVASEKMLTKDPALISWSSSLKPRALRGESHEYRGSLRPSMYRPFTGQLLYFDPVFNHRPGKMARFFPTGTTANSGFYCLAPGAPKPFSLVATGQIPDLAMYGSNSGQFYPRWTYEPGPKRADYDALFGDEELFDGYRRVDNITDSALAHFRAAFGEGIAKDDIFHYVYGVLHSQQYRKRFAADLRKMLPRIPLASDLADFRAFADAGKQLMDLHIGYEDVEPWPLTEHVTAPADADEYETFAVGAKKMRFASKTDKSRLIYSPSVTISGIPDEAHSYQLGSRSALEWIIDRYWVRTDKASGIVNDPNDWSREHGDPRYIVDLIGRVVRVSVETMAIVDALPTLPFDGAGAPGARTEPPLATAPDTAPKGRRAAAAAPLAFVAPEDMDRDDWRDWVDSFTEAQKKERRDELVVTGLQAGYTLQEMGDEFGFSRERARQIAASRGVKTRELRLEQKAQADRRRRRVARHVYGISLTHPELTVEEIAEWVDADIETTRAALEHRRAVHETRVYQGETGRVSDEELLAALAEWGAQTESLTGDDYTAWAAERGLPGKQTIAIRFPSWNDALAMAGLSGHVRDRGGLRPVIGDAELWASVVEFLRTDLPVYGYGGFDQFTQDRGLPSAATVRNRLGIWSDIHAKARDLLRYSVDRDGSWPWAEAVLDVIPGEGPRSTVTREQALESLRRVAARVPGPLTVAAHEDARTEDDIEPHMIQNRCGSWIRALVDAGLGDRLSAKARGKLARGEVDLTSPLPGQARPDLGT